MDSKQWDTLTAMVNGDMPSDPLTGFIIDSPCTNYEVVFTDNPIDHRHNASTCGFQKRVAFIDNTGGNRAVTRSEPQCG